ncbi:MAG: hypothetical protein ACOCXJ_05130, partial [Planctomycetota bacterium]
KHAASLLSQALRRYAGDLYGFDGVGATVRECRLLIREHLDGKPRQDFLHILEGLDNLRWSAAELQAERVRELAADSERWMQAREAAAQEADVS